MIDGDFECDNAKAASNVIKHGVTFEEAAFALLDPCPVDRGDDDTYPNRTVSLALNPATGILYVVWREGGGAANAHHQREKGRYS